MNELESVPFRITTLFESLNLFPSRSFDSLSRVLRRNWGNNEVMDNFSSIIPLKCFRVFYGVNVDFVFIENIVDVGLL